MNIKSKTVFVQQTGERKYCFQCDPDSPLGEIYDALTIFKSFVLQKIIENEEKEKKVEKSDEVA